LFEDGLGVELGVVLVGDGFVGCRVFAPAPEDLDVTTLRDSPIARLLRKVFAQIASLDRAPSSVR